MIYFAKNISKFINLKKINKFKVNYHTSGKHFYDEIGLDLLPHAISITLEIFKKFNFEEKNINKYIKKVKKNKWSNRISYDELKIFFNFSQNEKRKISKFSLQFNEKKIMRYTKKINTVFHNYIQFKNKMIRVDNPMQIMFKNFFKNINKTDFFIKNKNLTYLITKKMHKLIYF